MKLLQKFTCSCLGIVLALISCTRALADQDKASKASVDDRAWVKDSEIIYGVTLHGQLFRTRFNSNSLEILTDHGFEDFEGLYVAADKKHGLYSGRMPDGTSVIYLYDFEHGKDLDISKLVKNPGAFPIFSPDGKNVLLDGDPRQIFNVDTLSVRDIPFPDASPGSKKYFLQNAWSEDGRSLYLQTMTDHTLRYYRFELPTWTSTQIDGHPDASGAFVHFIQNGKEVSTYDPVAIQSMEGWTPRISPDGKLTVRLTEGHDLVIESANGKPVLVQKGGYDECQGEHVRVAGWSSDSGYLVYFLEGYSRIYGVEELKSTSFISRGEAEYWFW